MGVHPLGLTAGMGMRTRPVDMHPPYDHQSLAPRASVLYPAADVVDALVSQPSGYDTR